MVQLEHPPLPSNRGTHLHPEKRVGESGERGLKYDIMNSQLKYTFTNSLVGLSVP